MSETSEMNEKTLSPKANVYTTFSVAADRLPKQESKEESDRLAMEALEGVRAFRENLRCDQPRNE